MLRVRQSTQLSRRNKDVSKMALETSVDMGCDTKVFSQRASWRNSLSRLVSLPVGQRSVAARPQFGVVAVLTTLRLNTDLMWAARRKESATMLIVGVSEPHVGK